MSVGVMAVGVRDTEVEEQVLRSRINEHDCRDLYAWQANADLRFFFSSAAEDVELVELFERVAAIEVCWGLPLLLGVPTDWELMVVVVECIPDDGWRDSGLMFNCTSISFKDRLVVS